MGKRKRIVNNFYENYVVHFANKKRACLFVVTRGCLFYLSMPITLHYQFLKMLLKDMSMRQHEQDLSSFEVESLQQATSP